MAATMRARPVQIPASRRPDSPGRGGAGLRAILEELTALYDQVAPAPRAPDRDPRLAEIAAAVAEYRDAIDGRMPPGTHARGPATNPASTGPVTAQLNATVITVREVHDAVVASDPSSAELLYAIVDSMEMFAWRLTAEGAC
jgi:hypothetical protein